MNERRRSRRLKSFLRGIVYFDKLRGVMACLVRDLSDEGARIIMSEAVAIPDVVKLHIPRRDETLRARVSWRRGDEIGLRFISAAASTGADAQPQAAELIKRIAELENEIAALRRLVRKLKSERVREHDDAAA